MPRFLGLFTGLVAALSLSARPSFSAPSPTPTKPTTKTEDGSKLVHMPFEKAETEMLSRFRQDLSILEKSIDKIAVYQVSASGKLPSDYSHSLRQKIEEIILGSKQIQLIDCSKCQVSRLVKDEEGNLRYEAFSEEPGRPAKIASELGVDYLLYVNLNYTQSDLALRVRAIRATNQEVAWTNEYSAASIVQNRERLVGREYGIEQLAGGDSVSHVLIGEIAFSVVLSPGVAWLPTVDTSNGYGASRAMYPAIDFVIGEKYDNGHKRFGFLFGAIIKTAEDTGSIKLLPWALRLAPQFRYTFNPYNTSSARVSLLTEIGGFVSDKLATAYLSFGPELMMVKRFSIAMMPIYILPTSMSGDKVVVENEDGTWGSKPSSSSDRFGGFGVLFKASMNW